MAKTLDLLGEDEFTDDKGREARLAGGPVPRRIAKRQKADGSWTNETDRWMEGDPEPGDAGTC